MEKLYTQAVELLSKLIETPSLSRQEDGTAAILGAFLESHNIPHNRKGNNVWAFNKYYSKDKPTILLNSHHDTVPPAASYTRDPFKATIEDGKLFGLGSNDAGASVVSLASVFTHLWHREDMKYNLCLAITAEEENSGANGIESILPEIGEIDFAIVGEPTLMNLAIAERGLVVLDCVAHGKVGHAARTEGDNAIYKVLPDIEWFRTYKFPKVSELFGEVKMTVTVINAGSQHNVVPPECSFVVDVRVTDRYTNEAVVEEIRRHVKCDVTPRSLRMRPSSISPEHPVVRKGIALGRSCYGSPTTSDQALLSCSSLKLGVGDSARSHSADEFIWLHEIDEGIKIYIELLNAIL